MSNYDMNSAPVLAEGEVGEWVTHLQEYLQYLGHYLGDLDGGYGPATAAAVRKLQRTAGLLEDGVMQPDTWQALYAHAGQYQQQIDDVSEEHWPAEDQHQVQWDVQQDQYAAYTQDHDATSLTGGGGTSAVKAAQAGSEINIEFEPTPIHAFWQVGGKLTYKVKAKGHGGGSGVTPSVNRSYTYKPRSGTYEAATKNSFEVTIGDLGGAELRLKFDHTTSDTGTSWSVKLSLAGDEYSGDIGLNSDPGKLFALAGKMTVREGFTIPGIGVPIEAGVDVGFDLTLGLTPAGLAELGAMFAGGLAVATVGLTVASLYVFSTIVNNVRNAGKREGIMYQWALGYAEVLVEAPQNFPDPGGDWEPLIQQAVTTVHKGGWPDSTEVKEGGRRAAANDVQPFNDQYISVYTAALRARFGNIDLNSIPAAKKAIETQLLHEISTGANNVSSLRIK
jgi:putative peptidoglycan binding protein